LPVISREFVPEKDVNFAKMFSFGATHGRGRIQSGPQHKEGLMSGEIIRVDFTRRSHTQAEAAPTAMPMPQEEAARARMPATASLAGIILQLRAGARDTEAALQQMREGSTELIRLSADMKQHTGALAGQIGVVNTAMDAFGKAVHRMRDARSSAAAAPHA
jgi:hypothetical protein